MRRVVLSNSRRGMGTGCKRKFYLKFKEGLKPRKVKTYFRLGKYWHYFIEQIFTKSMKKQSFDFSKIIADTVLYIRHKEIVKDKDEKQELDEMILTLKTMMNRFEPTFNRIIEKYEILGIEVPFRLKFAYNRRKTGSIHPKLSISLLDLKDVYQPNNEFVGVVDGILREKNTDRIFTLENKSTASDFEKFENGIKYSFQNHGYSIAVELMAKKYTWGHFHGNIFNIARKITPHFPSVNQCKKCKGKGERKENKKDKYTIICDLCEGTGKGKISFRKINTTENEIMKIYNSNPHLQKPYYAKWYEEEFLPWMKDRELNFPELFGRIDMYISESKLKEFARETMMVFKNIRQRLNMKREECVRDFHFMKCKSCSYREICIEDSEILKSTLFRYNRNFEYPYEFNQYVNGSRNHIGYPKDPNLQKHLKPFGY
jgi:hypothetical protein